MISGRVYKKVDDLERGRCCEQLITLKLAVQATFGEVPATPTTPQPGTFSSSSTRSGINLNAGIFGLKRTFCLVYEELLKLIIAFPSLPEF